MTSESRSIWKRRFWFQIAFAELMEQTMLVSLRLPSLSQSWRNVINRRD
jgi:hypothetical protein